MMLTPSLQTDNKRRRHAPEMHFIVYCRGRFALEMSFTFILNPLLPSLYSAKATLNADD